MTEVNGTAEPQNDIQWTVGDEIEERSEENDVFDPEMDHHPPAAPSDGQGGHGLTEDETRLLLEKRRRLK